MLSMPIDLKVYDIANKETVIKGVTGFFVCPTQGGILELTYYIDTDIHPKVIKGILTVETT